MKTVLSLALMTLALSIAPANADYTREFNKNYEVAGSDDFQRDEDCEQIAAAFTAKNYLAAEALGVPASSLEARTTVVNKKDCYNCAQYYVCAMRLRVLDPSLAFVTYTSELTDYDTATLEKAKLEADYTHYFVGVAVGSPGTELEFAL